MSVYWLVLFSMLAVSNGLVLVWSGVDKTPLFFFAVAMLGIGMWFPRPPP